MPLPRERSTVDLQGAGNIVAGTGFAAAAADEAKISRTLDGVGDVLYQDAARLAVQKGKEDALASPIQRGALEYEQYAKQPDGSISRQVVRDEQGQILPPQTAPYSLSLYDRAFHAAALERYQVNVGNDARTKAAEMAVRFQTDPAAFSQAWSAYREAQLKGLAVPFAGPAAVTLEDVGQQHFRMVAKNRADFEYKASVEAHANDLERSERDTVQAVMQGRSITDPEVQRIARTYLDRLDTGSGPMGFYTPAKAEDLKRKFWGTLAFAQLAGQVDRSQRFTPGTYTEPGQRPAPAALPPGQRPPLGSGVPADVTVLNEGGMAELQKRLEADPAYKTKDEQQQLTVLRKHAAAVAASPEYRTDGATQPGQATKPPEPIAYATGRTAIESFLRGDYKLTTLEKDASGQWQRKDTTSGALLSLDERKAIAEKGTTLMEYSEKTREVYQKLFTSITGQQELIDRYQTLVDAQRTGSVNMAGTADEMKRLVQEGRPDLAISRFSFAHSVDSFLRSERARAGADVVASAEIPDLTRRILEARKNGEPTLFDAMSPEQLGTLMKAPPQQLVGLLKYTLASVKEANKQVAIPKASQRIIASIQQKAEQQQAQVAAGRPVNLSEGVSTEQTDENARGAQFLIEQSRPGHVWGKDNALDQVVLRRDIARMGVIDYRLRDYAMSAFSGGDPDSLRRAVGIFNTLYDMPNVGPSKIKSLLGEDGWAAYSIARNASLNGKYVEGEMQRISEAARGLNRQPLNDVALGDYVKKAETSIDRFIKGTGEINLGLFRVGASLPAMPPEMLHEWRDRVKQLAGPHLAPDEAATVALDEIRQRWTPSRYVYQAGVSDRQPAPFYVQGVEINPGEAKAWSDKAPERIYAPIAEDLPGLVRASVMNQVKAGDQLKYPSDLKLGVNMWLSNPHRDADGKLWWNVTAMGRAGAPTQLVAKPGSESPSGWVEINLDEQMALAQQRIKKTLMRDAAIGAETVTFDHARQLQAKENRFRLGQGLPPAAIEAQQAKMLDDYNRKVDSIRRGRFDPTDYGMSGF